MQYRVITLVDEFFVAEFEAANTADSTAQMVAAGYQFSAFNNNPAQRAELQEQPKFHDLCGPMWDGDGLRYECTATYAELSA